jgi:hypothetical protein
MNLLESPSLAIGGLPRYLAIDLRMAASTDVPTLISGPPHRTLAFARMIVARNRRRSGLRICDVARGDDAFAAIEEPDWTESAGTVLLREVQNLSLVEQAALANLIAEHRAVRDSETRRVIATSNVSLFDRVVRRTFDSRLFYLLNSIHIVVPWGPQL